MNDSQYCRGTFTIVRRTVTRPGAWLPFARNFGNGFVNFLFDGLAFLRHSEHNMAFKSLLDPTFRYWDSRTTDVRRTFERIRREQRLDPQDSQKQDHLGKVVVTIRPAFRASK